MDCSICSDTAGHTYVRWGRTTCPEISQTSLIYTGRVGGSWYGQGGGSAEYLCLPETGTEYSDFTPGFNGNQARQASNN